MPIEKIFTFWEGKMPEYLKLCLDTWKFPFTWALVDFDSMLYLIKNYDKIDFNKFKLVKDDNWNFSIIVDGHVKINYIHYKLDRTAKTPTTKRQMFSTARYGNTSFLNILNELNGCCV